MGSVAILIPVLNRPHRVGPVIDAFQATTPDCDIYFIADSNDRLEIEAIERDGRAHLLRFDGNYAQKINFGIERTDHPLIFLGADDLEPQPEWLDIAERYIRLGNGVVGVNDLFKRRRDHTTHFLMTRDYAQRPTFDGEPGPCCTQYAHWYVDDELIATAKARDEYVYAPASRVRHLHYLNKLAPDDATYQKGRELRITDRRRYGSRRSLWNASTFTVGVATYGDESWRELALRRALPSADRQSVPVIHIHGNGTLAEARNEIISRAQTEFLIFLDADDELEPGYISAMAKGRADVRAPMVRALRHERIIPAPLMPRVFGHDHACQADCLHAGNWVAIGAAARTSILRKVGGFRDEPIYEDYSLWGRCYRAGATFEAVGDAVYRQHLRRDSRNHAGDAFTNRHYWHQRIGYSIWPHLYDNPDRAEATIA